jgi:uncharacterized secreted protein with C-terminal beta-propeller domain
MRIVVALALVLGVTTATVAVTGAGGRGGVAQASALAPFDDCGQLLEHYRRTADEVVPYGLGDGAARLGRAGGDAAEAGSAAAAPEAAAAAPQAALDAVGPGATGTNVQEAGVDEPDIVKTNGELILAIADGALQVVEAGRDPSLAATLPLPGDAGHELLMDGDRALVLSRGSAGPVPLPRPMPLPEPMPDRPARPVDPGVELLPQPAPNVATRLTAVDLRDPARPRITATLTLDGEYRSARVAGGVARIVLASYPAPRDPETASAEDWLPRSVLEDGDGRVLRAGPLLPCDAVRRPDAPGLSLLSVLSLDLGGDLATTDATGVLADGETVYASAERLYVATTDWDGVQPGTQVHAFDLTDPRRAPYLASGRVEGTLLNASALSAHEGHLRVAVTRAGGTGVSESAVVVLDERGEDLVEVGRLDGLGRTERIHAVRFLGDLATVVTFRQTDPLYTVDLSEPTAPRLLGELKIPGYSAYLHPVGDDRLLGIGQDATPDGRLLGVQASLFDLRDLRTPLRVDRLDIGGVAAEVEHDPHAFLYWPTQRLAVFPIATGQAVALRVEGDRLTDAGTLVHPRGAIRRALVAGDVLYTVSDAGIQTADPTTLSPTGYTAF